MLAWCRWCALAYWWPMSGRVAVCPLPWLSLCLTPTNPPIKPNLPEAISAISNSSPSACMTDLTYTNVLCFYHPFPLLPSSLYLPLSVPYYTFALLTHSAACDIPSLLSLAVHHWLCPLPESHLCPRSASASPMQPSAHGPLRSRSSDRKKRPAYFCVCRCHFQYDTGEQMMHGNFHFEIGGGGGGYGFWCHHDP